MSAPIDPADLRRIARHARCGRKVVTSGFVILGAFKLCAKCEAPFPLELRVTGRNLGATLRDQPQCRACRSTSPGPVDGPAGSLFE